MHLMDFILVLVLPPCINAFEIIPFANKTCGHLEVQTPYLLFYGINVTITFKDNNRTDATAKLIYNVSPPITYEPYHHDNQTDIFTFILLQNRTAIKYQAYYVQYGTCSSGSIAFALREPPALGPRKNITGCDGCLIASVGEQTDTFKNREPLISCSMTNATEWTVFITINNKNSEARNSDGKYVIKYTVQEDDHMSIVKCSMTFHNITLVDTATLYVQGISTSPSQSPKPDLTSGVSSLSTKQDFTSSAHITQSSTVKPTTPSQSAKPEVTSVVSTLTTKKGLPSSAQITQPSTVKPTTTSESPKPEVTNVVSTLTTKQGLTSSAQITQSSTETTRSSQTTSTQSTRRINDKPSDTSSTTKSQPIYNEANTDSIDVSVLNQSAANDGSQNVIIAVACVVSVVIIVIAVVIAVICMKRKRRSMANVPLQDTPREDQVAQEKGYASIGGSECQYAVVNKPKKLSTLQAKQDSPVVNKSMEMQSKPEKPSGAGELIYADLDKEALTAKPIDSTPAGTVEYVGIDFARTVALQDANKQDE